jgi:hypothetical protein
MLIILLSIQLLLLTVSLTVIRCKQSHVFILVQLVVKVLRNVKPLASIKL